MSGLVTVEVIISAMDLKNYSKQRGLFGARTMSPFAVAWITGSAKRTTPTAIKGGRNPTFNSTQKFSFRRFSLSGETLFPEKFSCSEDSLSGDRVIFLTIEVRHKIRSFFFFGRFGEKLLGTLTLALSSDFQSDTPTALTKQLFMPPYGMTKQTGTLNFSVRISGTPKPATTHFVGKPRAVVAPSTQGHYFRYPIRYVPGTSVSAIGGIKSNAASGGGDGGGDDHHHGDGGGCGWDGGGDGGGGGGCD